MSHLNVNSTRHHTIVLCVCAAMTFGAPVPSLLAAPAPFPSDNRLLEMLSNPDVPMKQSDLDLALFNLRKALREDPYHILHRTELGLALLRAGDAIDATKELKQAQHDGGRPEIIVPALIDALLQRGLANEVLQEFPEPVSSQTRLAADILLGRAMALQATGRAAEARSAADRALELRRDLRSLVGRGTLALRQGDLPLARRLAGEAVKLSPNSDSALILNISILLQDGAFDKALAELSSFAARVPDSASATALRVEVLLASNRDKEASQAVEALAQQIRNAPLVTYYRAVLASRAKDAKRAWDNAQILPPEFILSRPDVALSVAKMAMAMQNLQTARAILEALVFREPDADLVSRQPNAEEARFLLATLQLSAGSSDTALKTLQPISETGGPAVQILLAQVYLQLGRYGDAVAALEHSRAADRNDAVKRELALSLFEYGDAGRAIEQLQQLFVRRKDWAVAAPLIEAFRQTGNLDQASAVVEQMRASGQPAVLEFYRGEVSAARGDLGTAVEHYGKALALDPKFLPALYFRAQVYVRRGNLQDARDDLNRIVAADPKDTPAYLQLAGMALNTGDYAAASAILARAIKSNPKDIIPKLAVAEVQLSRGDLNSAKITIDGVLAQNPDDAEALSLQGQWRLANGQTKQAIDSFLSLVASHPNSAAAYVVLAKAYDTVSDYVGAVDAAQKAVELAPNSVDVHALLVGLLIIGKRDDDALRVAHEFASTHPSPEADVLIAESLSKLHRVDEAKRYLEQRLAAQPSSPLVVRLSSIESGEGNGLGAQRLLSEWLVKHPADFTARLAYASLFLSSADKPSARRELETLLRQRPEDPLVLNDLGWLIQDEDLPRAVSLLSIAVNVAPASPQIADTLGWLKLKSHDAVGALPVLQRAHDLNSADGEIGYHLALALHETGKKAEAKKLLQSVLARSASFTDSASAKITLSQW